MVILRSLAKFELKIGKRMQNARYFCAKHDIFASIVLQRHPLIAPPMNVIEKTLSRVTFNYETAKSLYSDHELRHIRDLERAKMIASKKMLDETEMEASSQETALELEDKWSKEFEQFNFASSITADDQNGDKRSLNRCLDKNLLLVCKFKLCNNELWGLPRTKHREGETLRQTIDRIVSSLSKDSDLEVKVLGNAPCAVLKKNYSKKVQSQIESGKIGYKVFFFKADLIKGNVDTNKCDKDLMTDFAWLNRNECQHLLPREYWNTISNSLFMEALDPITVERVINKLKRKFIENDEMAVRN
ncbi:hypothetical protein B4U79_14993 [Dinothrombium tinctorium]|uniref:Large ribosomal subunit protein mL46 N-terminal domain-containing protein n=1 Tax=Dinothrombium tinctorium TaxID=1965070 RepID=A0A3S3RYE3_9ACAR|nr:hypothetical protein B4U79_13858 [Dinothrombium tinctorium]RWS06574.1 hypothetical protein B4U79_14993 [Dinothrombium tinctorium]